MNQSVIYYPYIRVPESPWFSRVLLYWDSVGSIVPTEYLDEPDKLGPYMKSLVKEGLVHQIVPSYHLSMVPNFTNAFLDYLDQLPQNIDREQRQETFRISESLGGFSVHMEKLRDLGEELVNRGLARRNEKGDYSSWYEVEPGVARDFMAYLAGVLGQLVGEDQFYPITDETRHMEAFLQKDSPKGDIRSLILDAVLPAPAENVEASRIADFKQKYVQELAHFRKAIEEEISQLSVIVDERARSVRMGDVMKRLRRDREDLVARMKEEKGWPQIGFADLCAVLGSSIASIQAGQSDDWRPGAMGAVVTVAPAIYNAFRGSGRKFQNKPLAYASLAASEFTSK
jgi:hypothetical protein